ncbi:MAG: hypothetical protein ACOYYS_08050 [Chloroflexota bacterium]
MSDRSPENPIAALRNLLRQTGQWVRAWVLGMALLLGLAGCSAAPQTEQTALTEERILSAAQPVGQTFVARFDGLSGVYFHLSPGEAGDGEVVLHLRADPQATTDLAVAYTTLAVRSVTGPGIYGFFVPAQADSDQAYYYAFLEIQGSGSVEVGSGPGNSYLDGALYQNHEPQDAQAVFQVSYSRRVAAMGLIKEFLGWAAVLLAAIFLYIMPGWGIFSVLLPRWEQYHWAEKAGLSAGLSLAIYPLLILWTDLIGLHLGAAYAWIPPLLGGYLLAWNFTRQGIPLRAALREWRVGVRPQRFWPDAVLVLLLGLVIFTRFWAIRSLEAPLWGDGYQHTMIAQLLVEHGGLFTSWQPYAELTTFTYHFGFHSLAAALCWLTGQDSRQAVLWAGQLLNVLAVLALYPLATRAGGSRWAGIVAVLVAGLLSPMPMSYVLWSRYTQLAGQAILPVAVWLMWRTLDTERALDVEKLTWRVLLLGWLAWGGLALAHYRVLIIAGLFVAAYWLLFLRPANWQRILKATLALGTGGAILFLPWFVRVFGGKLMIALGIELTTPAGALPTAIQEYNSFGDLTTYLPILLWLLLFLCLGWQLWQRQKNTALVGIWCVLLLLVANPYWIGLPGAGAINNFAILIMLYIPAGLIVGTAIATGIEAIEARLEGKAAWQPVATGAVVLGIALLGLHAADRMRQVDTSPYALVTRPDVRAAAWIQNTLPVGAKFAVNSFPAFTGTSVVGSDGGWWLPLLAQRPTTLPPLLYVSEQGTAPNYPQEVKDFDTLVHEAGMSSTEVIKQLHQKGITHVYIGQRQGTVNNPRSAIEPEALLASPHFQLLYHQDRVWVFKFSPEKLTVR